MAAGRSVVEGVDVMVLAVKELVPGKFKVVGVAWVCRRPPSCQVVRRPEAVFLPGPC